MPRKCPKSLCVGWWVGKPNLVKCFGPRLRLWTWTLDFVPGPSFSIIARYRCLAKRPALQTHMKYFFQRQKLKKLKIKISPLAETEIAEIAP